MKVFQNLIFIFVVLAHITIITASDKKDDQSSEPRRVHPKYTNEMKIIFSTKETVFHNKYFDKPFILGFNNETVISKNLSDLMNLPITQLAITEIVNNTITEGAFYIEDSFEDTGYDYSLLYFTQYLQGSDNPYILFLVNPEGMELFNPNIVRDDRSGNSLIGDKFIDFDIIHILIEMDTRYNLINHKLKVYLTEEWEKVKSKLIW